MSKWIGNFIQIIALHLEVWFGWLFAYNNILPDDLR